MRGASWKLSSFIVRTANAVADPDVLTIIHPVVLTCAICAYVRNI